MNEPADRGDRQRRWVAVSLGALVLLGGVLAILRTDASVEESSTARETTRVAVRALRSDVRAEAVQGAEAERGAERDFLGFRRPLLSGAPTLAEAAGFAGAAGIVAEDLRAARRSLPAASGAARLERLRVAAARGPLKQHASAETRITWNKRSTQYTTIMAVLAAGLFFVGFALTVEGSLRLASYALGMAVAVFAAGWAVWVHHLPIPTTRTAAVEATARGSVLTEDGRYAAAIASFDRAIAVDDGFAPAYTGRGAGEVWRGTPTTRSRARSPTRRGPPRRPRCATSARPSIWAGVTTSLLRARGAGRLRDRRPRRGPSAPPTTRSPSTPTSPTSGC